MIKKNVKMKIISSIKIYKLTKSHTEIYTKIHSKNKAITIFSVTFAYFHCF